LRIDARRWPLAAVWLLLAVPPGLAQAPAGEDPGEDVQRPGAAPFEPAPRADEEVIEEIIVYGRRDEWRLPDMGDELRREREELEKAKVGEVDFEFLPLYDPEQAAREPDLFRMDDPLQRVGKVELFRFRFGGEPGRR
jgi:hypothetical protein